MESFSVLQFLKDKTILVTGATGFLAKIFVEKILRIQPNLKKLYLLIRAGDDKSAKQRMFQKDLFRVLRDTWGDSLDCFILEKVVAVPGDILYEDLGIKDSNLKEEMYRQIDLVVNVAAITKFDERYDALLDTNTMGAFHVLGFAKNCTKIQMFVHLSSAYACGEKSGLIPENSFTMGEMLKWPRKLDIIAEKELVEQKLNQLQTTGAAEDEVTSIMKDLGTERFQYGQTHVFTKAMGEMLLDHHKDNLSIIIIRPTMITSTYKEPFSVGLKIPADMVVHSMIMAMVANANNPSSQMIYHVGSSLRNPIHFFQIHEFAFHYFTKNPYIDKYGNPVIVGKVKVLDSPAKFHRCMAVRSVLPLKVLELVNLVFCRCFDDICNESNRRLKLVMGLVNLYKPYMLFQGIFDDTNSEKLRMAMRESGMELDSFNFDPKSIDWEDYF
ncbi:Fatty acyl-CoA reductase 3 [Citrus sinensis]|uniref:Fatty acyl-CoA reductase 3 n=1 Tax=Citrus sinensis TaxID=2711 RepID=A0ACB8M1M4_CITSI|nr:Fatty acyl-CoA reductase 3 [Citrus sinensis]